MYLLVRFKIVVFFFICNSRVSCLYAVRNERKGRDMNDTYMYMCSFKNVNGKSTEQTRKRKRSDSVL